MTYRKFDTRRRNNGRKKPAYINQDSKTVSYYTSSVQDLDGRPYNETDNPRIKPIIGSGKTAEEANRAVSRYIRDRRCGYAYVHVKEHYTDGSYKYVGNKIVT